MLEKRYRTHSVPRVARSVRRLVAGCAAGCGILQSLSSAVEVPAVADTNAHPLSLSASKAAEDLEVRRSVNSLRSICSGLAPSADHDSEVAIHAGRLIRLKQTQTETGERYEI